MGRLFIFILIISLSGSSSGQSINNENVVKAYYSGFEKHDWNSVASQLAEGFTFTSPNNDDHISIAQFKDKCWDTNKFVEKVNYIKMSESGNELFLLVEIFTTDSKVVRNVDVFSFTNSGQIKSIEVFFGAGSKYPGNSK